MTALDVVFRLALIMVSTDTNRMMVQRVKHMMKVKRLSMNARLLRIIQSDNPAELIKEQIDLYCARVSYGEASYESLAEQYGLHVDTVRKRMREGIPLDTPKCVNNGGIKGRNAGVAPKRICPGCNEKINLGYATCPLCATIIRRSYSSKPKRVNQNASAN